MPPGTATDRGTVEQFDRFSREYRETLDKGVRISGEKSEYFSAYKAQYISKIVSPDFAGKLLDFGCGIGMLSSSLRTYLSRAMIHGYDISKESIGMISADLSSQGLFTADSSQLDNDYALIIISNVMHHIPLENRLKTAVELRDRLSTGGWLIMLEHNPLNPLTRWVVDRCPLDRDAVLLAPEEAEADLVRSGLRLVRRDYIVFFPRMLSWFRRFEPFLYRVPLGAQYAVVARKDG